MKRDAFQAIADPTRRKILGIIADAPASIHHLAAHFGTSRTAVSKHIKMLRECGLIVIRKKGKYRFCEGKLEKLGAVSIWLDQFKNNWRGA
jgi:DNA-binding transcriptional ArsR family regulator